MAGPSVLAAAERAVAETKRSLFPVRLERWLTLGLVAFLDQCGRGGPGTFNPGGPGGGGNGGGGSGDGAARAREAVDQALAFVASHAVMIALIAAAVVAFVLLLSAIVVWLRSRGIFMYIDNVATGRADVVRPWHQHAGRAGSLFAWSFGAAIVSLVAVLFLLLAIGAAGLSLFRHGARTGPIVGLVAAVLLLVALGLVAALFSLALRDFVAPLQWSQDLPCGAALRLFGTLLAAHPGTFVVYLVLKFFLMMAVGIFMAFFGCFACCCLCLCVGLLPVLRQALFQPLYYFERRWSLEVLAELGYTMPAV